MYKSIFLLFLSTSLFYFQAHASAKNYLLEKSKYGSKRMAPKAEPKVDIASGFADIVEKLLPAVVNISTTQEGSQLNNPNHPLNESIFKLLSINSISTIPPAP